MVRWSGFCAEHDTLEPETNLKNCCRPLAVYVARLAGGTLDPSDAPRNMGVAKAAGYRHFGRPAYGDNDQRAPWLTVGVHLKIWLASSPLVPLIIFHWDKVQAEP